MKSTLVRLSVVALALVGFAASSATSNAAKKATTKTTVVAMGTTSAPVCMPHDPTHCGLD